MKIHLDVDFDDVLTRVGVFGRWQQRTVVLLMIASFIGGKNRNFKPNHVHPSFLGLPMMNTAVTAALPDGVQCFFPDCEDSMKDGWAYKVPKNCKLIFIYLSE